jgi:hypothetical protein
MRLLYFECDAIREIVTDLWVDLINDISFLRRISTDPDKIEIFVYTRDKISKETEKTIKLMTLVEVTVQQELVNKGEEEEMVTY